MLSGSSEAKSIQFPSLKRSRSLNDLRSENRSSSSPAENKNRNANLFDGLKRSQSLDNLRRTGDDAASKDGNLFNSISSDNSATSGNQFSDDKPAPRWKFENLDKIWQKELEKAYSGSSQMSQVEITPNMHKSFFQEAYRVQTEANRKVGSEERLSESTLSTVETLLKEPDINATEKPPMTPRWQIELIGQMDDTQRSDFISKFKEIKDPQFLKIEPQDLGKVSGTAESVLTLFKDTHPEYGGQRYRFMEVESIERDPKTKQPQEVIIRYEGAERLYRLDFDTFIEKWDGDVVLGKEAFDALQTKRLQKEISPDALQQQLAVEQTKLDKSEGDLMIFMGKIYQSVDSVNKLLDEITVNDPWQQEIKANWDGEIPKPAERVQATDYTERKINELTERLTKLQKEQKDIDVVKDKIEKISSMISSPTINYKELQSEIEKIKYNDKTWDTLLGKVTVQARTLGQHNIFASASTKEAKTIRERIDAAIEVTQTQLDNAKNFKKELERFKSYEGSIGNIVMQDEAAARPYGISRETFTRRWNRDVILR